MRKWLILFVLALSALILWSEPDADARRPRARRSQQTLASGVANTYGVSFDGATACSDTNTLFQTFCGENPVTTCTIAILVKGIVDNATNDGWLWCYRGAVGGIYIIDGVTPALYAGANEFNAYSNVTAGTGEFLIVYRYDGGEAASADRAQLWLGAAGATPTLQTPSGTTGALATSLSEANTRDVFIAARPDGSVTLEAVIGEVAAWVDALTPTQIQGLAKLSAWRTTGSGPSIWLRYGDTTGDTYLVVKDALGVQADSDNLNTAPADLVAW